MKMKFIALLLITASAFTACKKDKTDATPAPVIGANTFTWTENGSSVINTADSVKFLYAESGGVEAYKNGVVIAEVMVFLPKGATTYNITNNIMNSEGHVMQKVANFDATAGTISVSTLSATNIAGTFSVTGPAKGGITAMSGTFSATKK
jgi:hypothetical protein